MRILFHCDFYTFLANLGDYDRAGLCSEGCCAVDGGGGAEGLAVNTIEADCLVVVEAGDVDETKLLQCEKAYHPILVTELGIVIDVKLLQL